MSRPRYGASGEKVFRISSAKAGFAGPSFALLVPAPLARLIGPDVEFTLELTDEGLLYRKVGGETRSKQLPEWLR